ncbi:MAG: DMT family transporter, partial [Paludibacteraceae bacterium]|nr:DMT family transporter [Paludibacteraceae bacterium]
MKKFLPYIAIIGAMLIWAASGIAIKMALVNFTSLTLLVMRFSLAIFLLLVIGLICHRNSLLGLQKVKWKDLPLFLLAGFFQPCLYYLLETYTYDALQSPTIAEALLSTSPVLSPLFAMVLLKENVTRNNIIGIFVSTVGMLMLVLVGSEEFSIGNKWGILTAFLSVVTAILYSVVLKKIPVGYNSLTIVFYVQICALFLFYPLWIVREGIHMPFPIDMDLWTDSLLRSLAGVGYLGVGSTVIA